jgi:hypothetical protein
MPWWMIRSIIVVVALVAIAAWWWVPKRQVARLRNTIPDAKDRA